VLDELPVLSELLFALHPVGDVGEKALDERRTAHCLADDATPVTDPALGPALGDDRVTHLELVFGRELCLHPLPDPGRRRRHEVRPERDSAGLERGCRVSGEPLDVARGELDRSLRPVPGPVCHPGQSLDHRLEHRPALVFRECRLESLRERHEPVLTVPAGCDGPQWNVVGHAGGDGATGDPLVTLSGDQHHRHRRVRLLNAFEQRNLVRSGQLVTADHAVHPRRPDRRQHSFGGRLGLCHDLGRVETVPQRRRHLSGKLAVAVDIQYRRLTRPEHTGNVNASCNKRSATGNRTDNESRGPVTPPWQVDEVVLGSESRRGGLTTPDCTPRRATRRTLPRHPPRGGPGHRPTSRRAWSRRRFRGR
jgi:hypothetical protein